MQQCHAVASHEMPQAEEGQHQSRKHAERQAQDAPHAIKQHRSAGTNISNMLHLVDARNLHANRESNLITIPRISADACRTNSKAQPCLAGAKPSVDPSKGVAAEGSARRRATASRQPSARPRDVASTTTGSAMAAALELLLTCTSNGDRSDPGVQLRTAAIQLTQQEVTKRKA